MPDDLPMDAAIAPPPSAATTTPDVRSDVNPSASPSSPSPSAAPALPLYRQLAGHYLLAIEAGTLVPGDRMPSVRTLMERHQVSLSTALQTCRHLEAQGVLEARPRSGYFVRTPARATLAPLDEPRPWVPDLAQYVGINQRVSSILARGLQASVHTNFAVAHGAPPLYPVTELRQATLRALRDNPLLYGVPPPGGGEARFRAAIARRALAARMNIAPEEIVVTHGCIEAINLALRAVASPGDVVAVESPTYYALLQTLESMGIRALEIPTSPQTGISLEALDLACETYDNIKAVIVVPHFQNPIGSVMPDAHKARLVKWGETRNIAIIEDDTYSALGDDDNTPAAIRGWDSTGNVIHCASLHKTLAPGMRLGWIAGGKWQSRIEMLKYAQTRPNEALAQIAMGEFMDSPKYDRHLRRLRAHLREQRAAMAEAIATYFPAGTRLTLPTGGLSLWVEMPGGVSSEQLFDAALAKGIRIAPGSLFSNSTRYDHFLRMNTGHPFTREIDRAVRTLATEVTRLVDAKG
ncbi:PLP-dependent aminotransferase family protein [Pandoraea sp. PE-S2R-1]|uniref:aminotransferase-like domain-containing protein n=1 Tax=Pandoraea sp. PE-S2R-1 TaxID=1986994 RepID=UPI0020161372|nr:PLP-dependent aminotransferase family protein [Pandoraea sp. PE-S2R-1]